jgi:ligand-binding sensor domain-containing protein
MARKPAPEKDVHALTFDSSGTAWIGTAAGLLSYNGRQIGRWTSADGLPSDRINLLRCDREGALWIGTAGGIARFYAGKIEALTQASPAILCWP